MKLKKINGLYHKPRFREIRVPFVISFALIAAGVACIVFIMVQSTFLKMPVLNTDSVIRKHFFTVIAVGDLACAPDDINYNEASGVAGACQMPKVADAIAREQADAVLLLGDIQYDKGIFEDFQKSFVPYFRKVTARIYPVPGNHDYGLGSIDGYTRAFKAYFPNAYVDDTDTPGYYNFRLGTSWQLIGLNSNCEYIGGCGVDSKEYNWLKQQLDVDPAPCTVAFWHHPVFTSGVHQEQDSTSRGSDFWNLLSTANSELILNGHDHDYERFAPQLPDGKLSSTGIREFVVGTGGAELRPLTTQQLNSEKSVSGEFGYLKLKLYPARYEWQYKSIDDNVLDYGSSACTP